jgi:catechol 2,3-dioxygenase-like lactoylglutathione lyase family enzyme
MTESARESFVGVLEVGIVVRDAEALTPFYRDGLGMTRLDDYTIPRDAAHASSFTRRGFSRRFAYGDNIVKLLQFEDPPTTSNPPGGSTAACTGLRYFTIYADDIEDVLRRCLHAGGRVVIPIQELAGGTKFMVLEDPEGSCWVDVTQRPTTTTAS